ncbi:dicarboxylate/amino acid:cation symporter [Limisphaera sp. VF-2]|uniref:dicarboxylate/amino acid:cation symporter n=1 Tax=Limisphaera sp. VF-2 TaxID=3400418 RepID=UPI003C1E09A6
MMAERKPAGDRARHLGWGLLIGVGVGLGLRAAAEQGWGGATLPETVAREVLDPAGQIFLRLLLLAVVPLVFASIALGVLELGRSRGLGRMAGLTFLLFGLNMSVAVGLGLVGMNWVEPGRGVSAMEAGAVESNVGGTSPDREGRRPELSPSALVDMFLPKNWIRAVVDFQLLPVITFALLFGWAARTVDGPSAARVQELLAALVRVMFRMVDLAMALAPVGVAALVAVAVMRMGLELLAALAGFVAVVIGAMLLHAVGVLGWVVWRWGGWSPLRFWRATRLALLTAFCTSSSAATLPTSLAVARDRLGLRAATTAFVLPLGATMNMSGTALYEGCVVLFVAQVYGADLAWVDQLTLLVLAVASAVAVASVPGASLPVIMGLLAQFRLPPEGIALVLGVDRLLDMARTTLNVAADLVTACVVDRVTGRADSDEMQQGRPADVGSGSDAVADQG